MKEVKVAVADIMSLVNLLNDMRAKVRNNYAEEIPKNCTLGLIKVTTLESYTDDLDEILTRIIDKWEKDE